MAAYVICADSGDMLQRRNNDQLYLARAPEWSQPFVKIAQFNSEVSAAEATAIADILSNMDTE